MANEKYDYGYLLNEELVRQGEDSHCKILQMISPNSAVLECGPAYGLMTKYLKENLHCAVQIIEYDRASFEQALQFADGGICTDIEDNSWLGQFENGSFDYIIYADILEHLRDPQAVLKKMRRFLKPEGNVLLSVPNVAHGDIILNLLGDRFNYTPLGLLDNTHIHLFARENLWAMIRDAGYYIAEEACIRSGLFTTEQGKFLSQEFSEKIKEFFTAYPNKDVYQFIYRLTLHDVETKSELGIIGPGSNTRTFSPIVPIQDLDSRKRCLGKVYFDCGSGLSEKSSIHFYIEEDNRIKHRIDLPEGCCAVRLDPVEGCGCLVWNLQVRCAVQFLKVSGHNGIALNDVYIFRTTDPQMYFESLPTGSKWLEIEAEIVGLEQGAWTRLVEEVEEIERNQAELLAENERQAAEYVGALQKEEEEKSSLSQNYEQRIAVNLAEYQAVIADKERELSEITARKEAVERDLADLRLELVDTAEQKSTLKQELEDSVEQRSVLEQKLEDSAEQRSVLEQKLEDSAEQRSALEQEIEEIEGRKSALEGELAYCQQHYHAAIEQRDDYQRQAAHWQNSYDIISHSQFWKITKPGRVIMDLIKYPFRKSKMLRMIGKGLRCLRENGISYTWNKVLVKLGHGAADEALKEIKKGSFPCLGAASNNSLESVFSTPVDIIIPVYNGFDYLERLFQTVGRTEVPYRLILIDDKSPDLRVLPLLKKYAQGKENVLVLENQTNLGFVKTVNRGLEHSQHHVALVNTDVELPAGWLERLMAPIVSNKKVATTTPFTNCGTICSFPNFCKDNALFWGLGVDEVDEAFRACTPDYPIIPTGVGFCMGMSREAIDKIGFLDTETFGKGYGEENDWCRRAAESGFLNVHVDNLFVYHKHGGSFESEEKKALIKEHLELLSQKHPDYNRLVAEYCQLDPCEWKRSEVKKSLLQNFSGAQVIVAFNHSWGGGASMYLDRERSSVLSDGKEFVQVEYLPDHKLFKIEYFYGDYHESVTAKGDIDELLGVLPVQIAEVWINELVTYPDLYTTLEKIADFAKLKYASLLFLLHDYFAVCPTVNLLDTSGRYCDIPEEKICQTCLENNTRFSDFHCAERKCGIVSWRENWSKFFECCTEIRTFSVASRKIFVRSYPDVEENKITVRPHSIDYLPQFAAQKKKFSDTLNIAVVGAIDEIKGVNVVEQIAKLVGQFKLNVKVSVVGYTYPDITKKLSICTGKYLRSSLPRLILENDIDIILIPSIWPETFSFTSQEAIKMGLPVACFDIGAPAERIRKYEKGLVVPQINSELMLYQIMKYCENNITYAGLEHNNKVLFVSDCTEENSLYRIDSFREELMFEGIASETVALEKATKRNLTGVSSIVFYRCSSIISVSYLSRRAKKLGIKLFLDIDDLFFYSAIIKASELPQKEKRQYIEPSMSCIEIIKLCDGITTSTEALAEYLRDSFPDKPVCVRRNSASLEMETLSVCAGDRELSKKSETVYLAYFSGSWTHDKDFELIADALVHIFDKYTNVKLRIYGCLHVPKILKDYQSRIELFDFTGDWRSLPEKIAQAHIHLAPLEDTVFNACKSENKWMEAALTGRPTVASYNSELALVIEDGVTGFLCKSQADWENVLSRLIEDPELRASIGKSAQENVLGTHLTRNSGDVGVRFITGN